MLLKDVFGGETDNRIGMCNAGTATALAKVEETDGRLRHSTLVDGDETGWCDCGGA